MLFLISFWLYLSVSILDLQLTQNHISFWNLCSHTCIIDTLDKPLTFILFFPFPYYECVFVLATYSQRINSLFCWHSVMHHESHFELATSSKFVYQVLSLRTLNILFSANSSHFTNSVFFSMIFIYFILYSWGACVGAN